MAHNHSFTEYVAKQFYNELYGTIDNYLQENKDDLDLRLYRVNNIDTITLADITVKFVDVSDLPGMAIEFDVAIEAQIEVHERDYHYDETDSMVKVIIPGGTILVDKQAYFMQTIGKSNNTIVHECVHWDEHKKAFALAQLYDSSLSSIGC